MRKLFSEKLYLIVVLVLFLNTNIGAQIDLEGYVYESNNRGYLNLVKVTITDQETGMILEKVVSNREGLFTATLPADRTFVLLAEKDVFKKQEVIVSTKGITAGNKVFTKIELNREPGYLFDVTMAEKWDGQAEVDAIQGALIEIYNNTTNTSALVLKDHPNPTFNYTFEKGNHYTVMIRKKGYFTKRMEAYVDVDGCILCFDGLDEIQPGRPGATDNLTGGNQLGVIVSNVELVPIKLNETIRIKNIYYDLAKWEIREDAVPVLEKLIATLRDNPSLIVELGSHTDSRGKDDYNLELSQKRAQSAVSFITKNGGIASDRISARGYGETELMNECSNGQKCSERRHQQNRRTELKIVGVKDVDPYDNLTLVDIIKNERFDQMLADVQNQEVIEIKAGEQLPAEILAQAETGGNTQNKTIPSQYKSEDVPVFTAQNPIENKPENATIVVSNDVVPIRPQQENLPVFGNNNSNAVTEREVPNGYTATTPVYETMNFGQEKEVTTQARPKKKKKESMGFDDDFQFVDESQNKPNNKQLSDTEFEVNSDVTFPPAKPLALDYTGFKVEFYISPSELPLSHEIFMKHGNIILNQRKDGAYAYLLGDFKYQLGANNFLNDVIKPQYPNAKLIQFINGQRVN